MEWLNFRHLHAFWVVARTRSFTRAAEQMHIAQSAVSAHVTALEDYLDEKLLIRTNRSVELTPAGRELMGYAQSIFEQSRAINTNIKDKNRLTQSRTLRIGVLGGASRNFIYRVLENYFERSSSVHIAVSTGSYEELYVLLKRFDLDVIITLELPNKRDMAELTYEELGASPMCIVATPPLIADLRRKKPPPAIDVYKFRHPHEVDVLDKYVRRKAGCDLVFRLDTDDIPLLRFFANSGKGVVVMPRVGVLQDLARGAVDCIELRNCPDVRVYGIFMQSTQVKADIEALLELSPPDL